ncbi:hypothetical protein [Pedobacter heparinus]|uniref:hypothetical protein n=1 Tax=Pedobacter heparinus TaxID=984 RepID=UPI00293076D1|nr:hypothetical protein [Pedobacter heparinus]
MSNLKSSTEVIAVKAISDLEPGDSILNLGEVLEIEENKEIYSIIILRMNQKQVFKFEKNICLYVSKEVEPA